MKNKAPLWELDALITMLESNWITIQSTKEIDHGLQLVIEDNLFIDWYHKRGSTVPRGKPLHKVDQLKALVKNN